MTLKTRFFFSRLIGCALALTLAASCSIVSRGSGGQISKVKYYHLDPTAKINTQDPTLLFEREHHLHGAVTLAEIMERAGHYYTVMWKADDRTQPVNVRLEYRQRNTALAVKTIDQEVTEVRRNNVTKFEVIGPQYVTDGPVTAWKVTLLRGKEELASQASYMWK